MIKQKVLYQAKVTTEYLPPATCPFLLSYHLPMRSLLPPFSQYCSILMQYLAEDPIYRRWPAYKVYKTMARETTWHIISFSATPLPDFLSQTITQRSLYSLFVSRRVVLLKIFASAWCSGLQGILPLLFRVRLCRTFRGDSAGNTLTGTFAQKP